MGANGTAAHKRPPKTNRERQRKNFIKEKLDAGERIKTDDAAFWENYTGESVDDYLARTQAAPANGNGAAKGRSASTSRTIHIEEKAAAAEGEGAAAAAAAGAAALAAVEHAGGLRADTLLVISHDAMVRVNEQHAELSKTLLEMFKLFANTTIGLMQSVRVNYLERVEAEANQIRLQELFGKEEDEGEGGRQFRQFMEFMKVVGENKASSSSARQKPKKRSPLGAP